MEKNCKWILECLSEFYIAIIIIIFPLIIGPSGYENVLEIKYSAYLLIGISYLVSVICTLLYFLIFKKINYFKQIKLKKVQYFLILFLLINILSYLFSPYKEYNLLIGLGRREGLLSVCLYTLTFLFLSFFAKFDKKYLTYISLSVILVSLIAILEYLGFNPFWIYKNNYGPYNMSFMTTIGNKDIISAFYTITLTISFCSFIFLENKKQENIIHILALLMGIFIFGVIEVDSGLVAFLLSLLIIIPFLLLNNKYLAKSMLVGAISIFSFALNYILNPVYRYSNKIYHLEPQIDIYSIIMLLVVVLFIISYIYISKHNFTVKSKKQVIKRWYLILPIILISFLSIVYVEDFNIPILNNIKEIMHGNFSDEIGTYRMFLWKRSIKLVKDYPILGTGPDTFSYRFMERYFQDVIKLDHKLTINDTAANVYLTMLVNIGVLGLLSYLLFLRSVLKPLYLKIKKGNMLSLVLFLGIMAFLIQDFFNLTVVIITPIFYTILAIAVMDT